MATEIIALLDQYVTTDMQVTEAKHAHALSLQALYERMTTYRERYIQTFKPAVELAEEFGRILPQADIGEWGNAGLVRVEHEDNGFVRFITQDHFAGETILRDFYIPVRYLEQEGEANMQSDAQTFIERFTAQKAEAQQKNDKEIERQERALLARLKAKYETAV